MKTKSIAALVIMASAAVLAAEGNLKTYMFPSSNWGILLPSGFSRENPKVEGPDFRLWTFTNSAGSRLTFAIGGHWERKGEKTDFKGFAALEYKTNLVRRVMFHSSQFSHDEIKKHNIAPPDYSHLLVYKAADPKDENKLNQAVESLFLKKKESNQNVDGTR